MSIKPIMELFWKIGITPNDDFLEQFNKKTSQKKISSSELLEKLIQNKFKNNEIKSISLSKANLIWITLEEEKFNELEEEWKSKKIPVTDFFNEILMDAIKNE